MRKLLNTYFAISKREFNGLLALVVLILVIGALPSAFRALSTTHPAQVGVQEVTHELQTKDKLYKLNVPQYSRKKDNVNNRVVPKMFPFDPNTIGPEDWQRLGLSARQSAAIINYREKGGKFRRTEDLQKMYTISEEMYKRLAPYVKIAPLPNESKLFAKATYPQKSKYLKPVLSVVDVNSADSATLVEIRGIGPAFASRIIRYRQRIGGFYKAEQLMEVYGLDSVKFNEIKDQITLDVGILRKIDINEAELEELKGHPYLKYKQANAVIQYRKQHGKYTAIADLSKVLILDAETINRLAPYINFKQ